VTKQSNKMFSPTTA